MSTYVNPVDPPDLGLLPTFRRLLPLWWEQRRLGVFGLGRPLIYVFISVAIPFLVSRAIDRAIEKTGHDKRWPYLAATLVLALIRFGLNFLRRVPPARTGTRIDARL